MVKTTNIVTMSNSQGMVAFSDWLQAASGGDHCVYAIFDRATSAPDSPLIGTAREAYDHGFVELAQRRIRAERQAYGNTTPGAFEGIAIRKKSNAK